MHLLVASNSVLPPPPPQRCPAVGNWERAWHPTLRRRAESWRRTAKPRALLQRGIGERENGPVSDGYSLLNMTAIKTVIIQIPNLHLRGIAA